MTQIKQNDVAQRRFHREVATDRESACSATICMIGSDNQDGDLPSRWDDDCRAAATTQVLF
jgi:hypothetical protein